VISPGELRAIRSAPKATLRARPRSEVGLLLTKRLAEELSAWEAEHSQRANKRRSRLENFELAVGAFTADLLHACHDPDAHGWTWRSMNKGGFTGELVSFRNFDAIVRAWSALELIERRIGYKEHLEFDPGDQLRVRGKASRFRVAPKLLSICAECGVTPGNVGEAFFYVPPEHPLRLHESSRRGFGWKVQGKPMEFARTPKTHRLEAPIKKLNDFLTHHVLTGGTHRWFTRVFNNGDADDFAWNKGGRLYSDGKDAYQQLDRDTQRLKMTIDRQGICEIDIRASYLTIFHARHRAAIELDTDPYRIRGLPRDVVKTWCAVRFGTKYRLTRWPKESIDDYAKDHSCADLEEFNIRDVEAAVCGKFPLMARWLELPETWADLMWNESEAVIATVIALMEAGVPSLPVHDSLIVPLSAEASAMKLLRDKYTNICGIIPALTVHRQGSRTEYPSKGGQT
jgi:hypothetical protein